MGGPDEGSPNDMVYDSSMWTQASIDKGNGILFNLPDGWDSEIQDSKILTTQKLDFIEGTPAKIEKTTGGRDGQYALFVTVDLKHRSFDGNNEIGDIFTKNFKGKKYQYTVGDGPGIGNPSGTVETVYYLDLENGYYAYFQYARFEGEEDKTLLIEAMLDTVRRQGA